MRFTDKAVRSMTNPGRYTETGSSGFHLNIKKKVSGVYKSWVFRYQLGGKRYDFALGSYPKTSLAEARKSF